VKLEAQNVEREAWSMKRETWIEGELKTWNVEREA